MSRQFLHRANVGILGLAGQAPHLRSRLTSNVRHLVNDHFHHRNEWIIAALFVLVGICVAMSLAPKDEGFLPNALFMWLPQAAILLLLFLTYTKHPAAIGGAALTLSIYLLLFHAWLFSRIHKDSMAWLGYLYSLPGAAVGALVLVAVLVGMKKRRPVQLASGACLGSAIGLAANQAIVCSTVMYCLGK